jgi:hypothetical protein
MRAVLHAVALALALPQILLCAAFALLDHVARGAKEGGVFMRLLTIIDALLGWAGLVILLGALLLLAAGFSARWRPFASGLIVLLVVTSTIAIFALISGPPSVDGLVLFLPGAIAAAISARLAMLDWPRTVPA